MPPRHIPRLIDAQLYPAQGEPPSFAPIDVESVESDEWFEWLKHPLHSSFSYQTLTATLTVRREQKRNGWYWYAYRSFEGKLHKVYLGKAEDISLDRLSKAAATLTGRDEPSERASRLRMTFFGPPQILRDSALAPLSVTKAVALLAYLSAHERPQRRDHLLSLFWPESSSAQARKNLRNVLWTIRSVLGPDALAGEATLTLHDQVWIDVRDFEQLHRDAMRLEAEGHSALKHYQKMSALYQGSFLDGIALSDSAEFDTWVALTREHFHELHLRALRAIALAHRAEGRWHEVVTVARTAVRQDALQEPMYRALMEAHAQMGDRAMAIRQYDSLRATLDRELGVTPLPETDQLRAEILQGKLTEAPDAHVTVAETPVTPGAAEAQPTRSQQPFIGREQEIATLDGVWAMARATPARVALISGEAGVGKSRLWQMWSSRLEPDVTLLTARCLPTTQSLPFAPLVDLLRGPIVRRRLAKLAHPSPPVWLDDLLQLVPELRETLPAHIQAPALPAIEEQRRMRDAVEHDWPHPLALVEHSHAGLASAYVAGASNLPFDVLRGYTGSDLPKYNEHIRFIPCPFTGEEVAAVQSVRPDVTVIHAQKADRKGNVLLWGILGVQKEAALAAKHAIVTVEEVVDDLDAWPNAAILPSWAISAVCEVPGRSHPSYAQGYYERDNHFYQAWDKISRSRDSFQAWMQRHVLDTADFSEFTQTLRETEEMEAR